MMEFVRKLWGFIGRIPFREVWLSVLVLALMRDQYPFSHFPMYSGLSREGVVFYFTDWKGEVIGFRQNFSVRSDQARKVYQKKRGIIRRDYPDKASPEQEMEADRRAAQELFAYLLDTTSKEKASRLQQSGMKLYETVYERTDEGIKKKTRLIMEWASAQGGRND